MGVYASPDYLARQGTPKSIKDLEGHCCIGFVMPGTGRLLPWTFPQQRKFSPKAEVRCVDDVLATVTLARAGVGLTQAYDILVEQERHRGELVEVLPQVRGATRTFSIVYPRARALSAPARALVDFMLGQRH